MKPFQSNQTGFTTPLGYFDQLEEKLLNENKETNKGNAFVVPDNYFEQLEEQIQLKVQSERKGLSRKLWISVSSIAACLAIGVSVVYFSELSDDDSKEIVYDGSDQELYLNPQVEDSVYESLYETYFVEEEQKKSPTDVSLDDLEKFYLSRNKRTSY